VRDLPGAWIGLLQANQDERLLRSAVLGHQHLAAEVDHAGRAMAFHDDSLAQDRLQLENATFQERLIFLGGDVVGVFRQVALANGVVEALGHRVAARTGQLLQLVAQLGGAFRR
jgi:hypothetical protein